MVEFRGIKLECNHSILRESAFSELQGYSLCSSRLLDEITEDLEGISDMLVDFDSSKSCLLENKFRDVFRMLSRIELSDTILFSESSEGILDSMSKGGYVSNLVSLLKESKIVSENSVKAEEYIKELYSIEGQLKKTISQLVDIVDSSSEVVIETFEEGYKILCVLETIVLNVTLAYRAGSKERIEEMENLLAYYNDLNWLVRIRGAIEDHESMENILVACDVTTEKINKMFEFYEELHSESILVYVGNESQALYGGLYCCVSGNVGKHLVVNPNGDIVDTNLKGSKKVVGSVLKAVMHVERGEGELFIKDYEDEKVVSILESSIKGLSSRRDELVKLSPDGHKESVLRMFDSEITRVKAAVKRSK